MKQRKYDLKSFKVPYQMHDEEINRVLLSENSLQLCIDDLHLIPKFSKASIEFSGIEDVSSCAYIDIYDMNCCNILGGKRYYADEFDSIWAEKEMKLIILDTLVGYGGMLMITGELSECDVIGEKCFSLVVYASSVTYTLYE